MPVVKSDDATINGKLGKRITLSTPDTDKAIQLFYAIKTKYRYFPLCLFSFNVYLLFQKSEDANISALFDPIGGD